MSSVRDTSGALKTLGFKAARDPSATLRTITQVRVRDSGGVLRELTGGGGGLSVSLAPSSVSGFGYSIGEPRIATSAATISVVGGTAPYTIVWTFTGGGWSEINVNSLTTGFRGPGTPPATSDSTSLYATVTDANSLTGVTNSIEAQVTNEHSDT